MKKLMILFIIAFGAALAILIGVRLSEEALAVLVGVACGVLAAIPTSLIILLAMGGRRADPQPPNVIVVGRDDRALFDAQAPPTSWMRDGVQVYDVDGRKVSYGNEA